MKKIAEWKELVWKWSENKGLCLEWETPESAYASECLSYFVRSGLLRNNDNIPKDIEFSVRQFPSEEVYQSVNKFLENLSGFARFLGKGDAKDGELHLEAIELNVHLSISRNEETRIITMEPILHCDFYCQGVLDNVDLKHTGTFTKTIRYLVNTMNNSLRGHNDLNSPGLYYDKDIKKKKSRFRVIMKS